MLYRIFKSKRRISVYNKKNKIERNQKIAYSILDLIGNTPLLKLTKLTRDIKCNILAKLKFLNPGGSVKDRIGIAMIEAAEKQGLIQPGYVIVEPTSGNTGIGLALVALVKGYKMIFTLSDKDESRKKSLNRPCQNNRSI